MTIIFPSLDFKKLLCDSCDIVLGYSREPIYPSVFCEDCMKEEMGEES